MPAIRLQLNIQPASPILRAGLITALLLSCVPELGSESVSLSATYPAPSGVYTQMITTGRTNLARDGGRVAIGNIPAPQAKLEVGGDIIFQVDNIRVRPVWINGGEDSYTGAGSYGRRTGFTDTCDGSNNTAYTCGAAQSRSCFDIVQNPPGQSGGTYRNVTCRRALSFVEF